MIRRARKFIKTLPLLPTLAVILIIVTAGVWGYSHFHKHISVIPTMSATREVSAGKQSVSAPVASDSPKTTATNSTAGGSASSSSSSQLQAPSGSFVSNHHPSSSTSLTEESLCETTPGASCYIKFEKGSEVHQLSTQVASSGSTAWTWNISDAGLTSGDWQVTAVATLNGQVKTTSDPLFLVIQ